MIKYCTKCMMPNTKPDLNFDEKGICAACNSFFRRKSIDWKQREKELHKILDRYCHNNTNWDCIIPVSGGKDSTYQTIKVLQMGLNPLCVTATTCHLSTIGRKNIENIKNLGVDYIEFSTNPVIRKKLNLLGLTLVGDISWPEHVSIFTVPVIMAVRMRIPLIIWGENSQNEYGGPASQEDNHILNRRWLEEFGGLLGLRYTDLIGQEGITEKDLLPYIYPSDAELEDVGVTGFFLGHYIPWDGYSNALISQAHGLTTHDKRIETTIVNYENLDNLQAGIHDYFKFLKFGFGRATDHVSLHIRRGRLTREDGLELVKKFDGKFPWTYLSEPIQNILDPLSLSIDKFIEICDKFTNVKLFHRDSEGHLIKDVNGNLTKINYDNQ